MYRQKEDGVWLTTHTASSLSRLGAPTKTGQLQLYEAMSWQYLHEVTGLIRAPSKATPPTPRTPISPHQPHSPQKGLNSPHWGLQELKGLPNSGGSYQPCDAVVRAIAGLNKRGSR